MQKAIHAQENRKATAEKMVSALSTAAEYSRAKKPAGELARTSRLFSTSKTSWANGSSREIAGNPHHPVCAPPT
jgi:hypothetical protein